MEKGVPKGKKKVSAEHPIIKEKIKKSLGLSKKEGASSTIHSSISLNYLSPFAIAMNATASQIGILHAGVSLLPSIAQLKAPGLMEKYSRKKIVLNWTLIRIFLWIPIMLTALMFYLNISHAVWALIVFSSIAYICIPMLKPAWFSWMGSLVDEHKRGKYFSERNRIATFAGVITLIFGAIFLDWFKKLGSLNGNEIGFTLLGFIFLFTIAAVARAFSWKFIKGQYEPKIKIRKKDRFTLKEFLRESPKNPFGKFALLNGVLSIALGISAPFWAIYLLRNLNLSYVWFIAIMASPLVFQSLFFPLMGRFSDKFGNIRLLKISLWFRAFIPFIWVASIWVTNPFTLKIYLLVLNGVVSGFSLSGHILATNNYVYDAVKKRKQGYAVSYLSFLQEIGLFIGASIGSFLALLTIPFMNIILFIFLVSGILRIILAMAGGKYLQGVGHIHHIHAKTLIREFNPVHGLTNEVHHSLKSKEKVEHYV